MEREARRALRQAQGKLPVRSGETEGVQSTPARRARRGKKKEDRGQRSEVRGSSSKFENAPEINQKTWNLEPYRADG